MRSKSVGIISEESLKNWRLKETLVCQNCGEKVEDVGKDDLVDKGLPSHDGKGLSGICLECPTCKHWIEVEKQAIIPAVIKKNLNLAFNQD